MASAYWIKLYHEILDDPKMGHLPHRAWRRALELMLMAGEMGCDGHVPHTEALAWRLRCDACELAEDLEALMAVGIVAADDNGWVIVHFAERQAPVSDAERQRQHRKRDTSAQYYGHDIVTKRNVDKKRIELEENTVAAKPATPPSYSIPISLDGWIALLREPPPSTNRTALLRAMGEAFYPSRDPPPFSRFGQVAKQVGGAERLAQLLWKSQTGRVTGDYLSYCVKMAKGKTGPTSAPITSSGRWQHKVALDDPRTEAEIEIEAQELLEFKRKLREKQAAEAALLAVAVNA